MLSVLAWLSLVAAPAYANSKYAAFVVHADSGDVFFDRYSTETRYPASLTKMMTLYLLFEELEAGRLTLQSTLKVSETAAGQPPSKLGLSAGDTITVEKAIEALVVKSANDVAVVVAEHLGGAEWKFARQMTNKARAIGMSRTTFRNASGLPNSKQVTTARDMAVLGRRLMHDFPQYFDYFSLASFTWDGRTYRSHNKLIGSFEGADGLKTGYTRRSGFNLVTTTNRGGERLIGVVLGGRSGATRDRHMREILDQAHAAIKASPALVASLHRNTPSPRIKPTLLAQLQRANAAPTIAENAALRNEIEIAADAFASSPTTSGDALGALIASADTDDFNEFQRVRIAALNVEEGFFGEGDVQEPNEFAWSVQIGAFSSKPLAQRELEAAVAVTGLVDRSRVVLPTPRDDGTMLYRARITRLSEIEAAATCASLEERKLSCFIVSETAPQ